MSYIKTFIENPNELCKKITEIVNNSKSRYDKYINFDIKLQQNRDEIIAFISDDIFEFDSITRTIDLLNDISNDKKLKDIDSTIKDYNLSLNNDINVYNLLKNMLIHYNKNSEECIFLRKIISGYEQRGVHLKTSKIKVLQKRIETIESKMINKMKDKSKIITLSKHHVSGLSPEFLKFFYNKTTEKYDIPLNRSTYQVCLKNLKNGDIRKNIELLYYGNNKSEYLARLIVYRHQYATMLKYPNYCSLKTHKSCKAIISFVENIIANLDDRCRLEVKILSELKSKREDTSDIYTWDLLYYLNKWKKIYGVTEKVSEYFELLTTLTKIFELMKSLFSLSFEPCQPIFKIWDSSVITYCVKKDNIIMGYLILDLYARPNKNNNNKTICIVPRSIYPYNKNIMNPAIVTILQNFNGSNSNNQVLLTIQDITNLFREFGHTIRYFLSVSKFSIFNGMNMDLEIAETMSTFFQHLSSDGTILEYLSSHYKTHKKLDAELIDKIVKVKKLDYGITYKYRCLYALYDIFIHSCDDFIRYCYDMLKSNDKQKKTQIRKLILDTYNKFYDNIMNANGSCLVKKNPFVFHPSIWTYLFNGYDDSTNYTRIVTDIYSFNLFNYVSTKGILDKVSYNNIQSILFKDLHNMSINDKIKKITGKTPLPNDLFYGFGLLHGTRSGHDSVEYSLYRKDKILNKDKLSEKSQTQIFTKNVASDSDDECGDNVNFFEPISDSEIPEPKKI